MSNPTVSIIIPTYNRAGLLASAIESVLRQTFDDYEIIVVDDGSTDETRAVLEPFMDRLEYIHQENQGKATALNNALRQIGGRWVAILDSDDQWLPEKLEEQMRAVERYGQRAGFIFTDAVYGGDPARSETVFQKSGKHFREEYGLIDDAVDYVLHPRHGIYLQCSLIRNDLLRGTDGFDAKLKVGDDTDMIFQLALLTRFAYVNKSLTIIDRTPTRTLGLLDVYNRDRDFKHREREYMYEKWLSLTVGLDSRYRRLISELLGAEYAAWANHYLETRDYHLAAKSIRRAFELHPGFLYRIKRLLIVNAPFLVGTLYQWRNREGRPQG